METYRRYRWAGRLTGFLGIVFFVSYFVGEGIELFKSSGASHDILFVLTLFSLSLVAYIAGWFVEIIGGSLMGLTGLVLPFYLMFSPVYQGPETILFFSLPFLIPGILYIIAWRIKVLRKIRAQMRGE
ncbi:MAG: hypothetical protein ACLFPE_05310 [Bacteroidales bacterium]